MIETLTTMYQNMLYILLYNSFYFKLENALNVSMIGTFTLYELFILKIPDESSCEISDTANNRFIFAIDRNEEMQGETETNVALNITNHLSH